MGAKLGLRRATFSEPHLSYSAKSHAAYSTTLTIRKYRPRLVSPQGSWLKSAFWHGVSPRWLHVGYFGQCLYSSILMIMEADPKLEGQV